MSFADLFPPPSVRPPAVLAGQSNGRLPSSILVSTPGQAGGATVRLVSPADRAWRAMCAAALAGGHVLKTGWTTSSYRSYAEQETMFQGRYSSTPIVGQPSKVCGGIRYWLERGAAPAACPGTSNHGWGLAVDVGEERDGDIGVESIDDGTLAWLVAHAASFGFSPELLVEPWHWRYYTGDDIPDPVLAYEETDMPITKTDADLIARTLLLTNLGSSGPTVGVALQSTYQWVKQLLESGGEPLTPAQLTLIQAAVEAGVDDALDNATVTTTIDTTP